jgi:hypothetical protein
VSLDFRTTDSGSIVLLQPLSQAAWSWCREHLPSDAPMFGTAYAIERRYIDAILIGIDGDGLEVQ